MSQGYDRLLAAPTAGPHVVHFYRDHAALQRAVGAWLTPALATGGGALLVCTPEHALHARSILQKRGIDVAACERQGRLIIVDARTLMSSFIFDGVPNGAAFKRLAHQLLRRIGGRIEPGKPIHAWGEMVDLLSKAGEHAATHRLEALWNEMLEEKEFRLLCSYEIDHLDPSAQGQTLEVCSAHTRFVPEEDEPALEAAIHAAFRDVFGSSTGWELEQVLPPRHALGERMPHAEAALLALHQIHPEYGARVLRQARTHLASRAPELDLYIAPA